MTAPDGEKAPEVVLEVRMSPEDYMAIKRDADWDGKTVAKHLIDHALGRTRRGC